MSTRIDKPAGSYSTFVRRFRKVLKGQAFADVPCDGCTVCCFSVYDGLTRKDMEQAPLHMRNQIGKSIPPVDDNGHCPHVVEHGCGIRDHAPLSCRRFDCRLYVFTGVTPTPGPVAEVVRTWRPRVATREDLIMALALRMSRDVLLSERQQGTLDLPAGDNAYGLAMATVSRCGPFLARATRYVDELRKSTPQKYREMRERFEQGMDNATTGAG